MKNEHPGQLIKAAMKIEKISQTAFARAINMAPSQLSETLSGRRPITPALCIALENEGVGDAEIWLFMYVRHELSKARQS